MRSNALLLSLTAVALVACSEKKTAIPLAFGPGDLALVVATVNGHAEPSLVRRRAGEALEVTGDEGKPIYTWVFSTSDFVHADGTPLVGTELDGVRARLVRTGPDSQGRTGACDRCLIPGSMAPQRVSPGDSCTVPAFSKGAVWRADGASGAYACRSAPDGRLCAVGNDEDTRAIEEVRLAVRLDWPGTCACSAPTAAAPSLASMEIRPIAPESSPFPLDAFAQRDDGVVAAFSRQAALLWDPATQRTEITPLTNFDYTVRTAAALQNGDFLVGSEDFNSGWIEQYTFHVFSVQDGKLSAPRKLDADIAALPVVMKHLGGDPDFSLYLAGSVRGIGSIDPAVFACTERNLACQQAGFRACPNQSETSRVSDIEMLPNGAGVAINQRSVYLRAPNPPPMPNPLPRDVWECHQFTDSIPYLDPADPRAPVRIGQIDTLGHAGDRVFACGLARVERCQADYAVVLTATVSGTPLEVARPSWRIAHRGADWSRCRGFVDLPGEPAQVRLRLSGSALIDFDAEGRVTRESTVSAEYGTPPPGYASLERGAPGWMIATASENGLWTRRDGAGQPFSKIYGPDAPANATHRALVARPDGTFLAFGDGRGGLSVRVDANGRGSHSVLADPTAALSNAEVRGAVLDTARTTAATNEVVAVGWRGGPLVMRLVVSGTELVSGTVLDLPPGFEGLRFLDVAEVSPGRFITIAEGSKIARIENNEVTEVTVDWDDPATEALEQKPVLEPDACSGAARRVDTFTEVGGAGGVGWVAGRYGMVMRVVDDRAERFTLPRESTVHAIDVTCPDLVRLAGRGRSDDASGVVNFSMQFFELGPQGEVAAGEPRDPRGLTFSAVGADEVIAVAIFDITAGTPFALVPDASARRNNQHAPFAVVLESGFLHRMFVSEPLQYTRVPFRPSSFARASNGVMLFGGSESRLAVGVPGLP